jgi:hypothetical protein
MNTDSFNDAWKANTDAMTRGVSAMCESIEAVTQAQTETLGEVETMLSAGTDPKDFGTALSRAAERQMQIGQTLATRLSTIGQEAATGMMSAPGAAEAPKPKKTSGAKSTKS